MSYRVNTLSTVGKSGNPEPLIYKVSYRSQVVGLYLPLSNLYPGEEIWEDTNYTQS